MTYTSSQIENAKRNYSNFVKHETAKDQSCYDLNPNEAHRRAGFHNKIIGRILSGDIETIREWKLFFLTEEVKKDQKAAESKAKLTANKEASADILAPIKSAKRLVEFGKWLNTSGNKFRKEHFSKKYTNESVNTFLAL